MVWHRAIRSQQSKKQQKKNMFLKNAYFDSEPSKEGVEETAPKNQQQWQKTNKKIIIIFKYFADAH